MTSPQAITFADGTRPLRPPPARSNSAGLEATSTTNNNTTSSSSTSTSRAIPGERRVPSAIKTPSHTTQSASMSASSPPPHLPSSGGRQDNNVFGRVVRKLSKRVRPPHAGRQDSGEGPGLFATKSGEQDPPSYSSSRAGSSGSSPAAAATSAPLAGPSSSRSRGLSRDRTKASPLSAPVRVVGRKASLEWGPPPLSSADRYDTDFIDLGASSSALPPVLPPILPPKTSQKNLARHASTSQKKSAAMNSSGDTDGAPQHPLASRNSALRSRSFDSLLSFTNLSETHKDASPRVTTQRLRSDDSLASMSSPPGYVAKVPTSPAALMAEGRKTKISSTARGKPAQDVPIAMNGAQLVSFAGYWAPRGNSALDGGEDESVESDEVLRKEIREREALAGRGPYWAVQRGWTKGVVTSQDEANRRTKNFPGPIVRYFEEDRLDEAMAFVKAGAVKPTKADNDNDARLDVLGQAAPGINGLSRSVSLMEKRGHSSAARGRHNRGVQGSMFDARSLADAPARPVAHQPLPSSSRDSLKSPPRPPMLTTPAKSWSATHSRDRSAPSSSSASPYLSGLRTPAATTASTSLFSPTSPTGPSLGGGMTLLMVDDLNLALRFYQAVLGLETTKRWGSQQAWLNVPGQRSSPILCLRARSGQPSSPSGLSGVQVLLPLQGSGPTLLARLKEGLTQKLIEGSASSWGQARLLGDIEEKPWGSRELSLVDPSGHIIIISQDRTAGDRSLTPGEYTSSNIPSPSAGVSPFLDSQTVTEVDALTLPPATAMEKTSSLPPLANGFNSLGLTNDLAPALEYSNSIESSQGTTAVGMSTSISKQGRDRWTLIHEDEDDGPIIAGQAEEVDPPAANGLVSGQEGAQDQQEQQVQRKSSAVKMGSRNPFR